MQKFIFFFFKILYQCLNMMLIKIHFELDFKLCTKEFFSIDQKQQKLAKVLRVLHFFQKIELFTFFSKNLKVARKRPKSSFI